MFFSAALVILMIIKVLDLYENLYLVVHVLQEHLFVCARTEYFLSVQPLLGLLLKFYIYMHHCAVLFILFKNDII